MTDILLLYVEVLEGFLANPQGTVGNVITSIGRQRFGSQLPPCLEPVAFDARI